MSYSADRYAYYIVHRMLRLKEGEGLTLNANPDTIEFAHKVAHEAAETTGCTVSLVYIENGTPQSVDEIEPSFKPHKALRPVMLHLASFSQAPFNPDEESDARYQYRMRLPMCRLRYGQNSSTAPEPPQTGFFLILLPSWDSRMRMKEKTRQSSLRGFSQCAAQS